MNRSKLISVVGIIVVVIAIVVLLVFYRAGNTSKHASRPDVASEDISQVSAMSEPARPATTDSAHRGATSQFSSSTSNVADGVIAESPDPETVLEIKGRLNTSGPVGLKYGELRNAVTANSLDQIRGIVPSLVAMVAAESPAVQANAIGSLTEAYNQAKIERSEHKQAIFALVLAELHRHAKLDGGESTKEADIRKPTQEVLVAGGWWTATALMHITKVQELEDFRKYLVSRTSELLSLHLWFAERINGRISPISNNTLKQLESMASLTSQPAVIQDSIARYNADIQAVLGNTASAELLRRLIADYVAAYNKKDTVALQGVFSSTSSAYRQLTSKAAEQIISPTRWIIDTYDVQRIIVQGGKANIDLLVQYKSRDGVLAKAIACSFEARKGADNAWKLE